MNVIQWMYKKEQVQTTLSNIIQWLSMLDVAPGLRAATFENLCSNEPMSSQSIRPTFCFQL